MLPPQYNFRNQMMGSEHERKKERGERYRRNGKGNRSHTSLFISLLFFLHALSHLLFREDMMVGQIRHENERREWESNEMRFPFVHSHPRDEGTGRTNRQVPRAERRGSSKEKRNEGRARNEKEIVSWYALASSCYLFLFYFILFISFLFIFIISLFLFYFIYFFYIWCKARPAREVHALILTVPQWTRETIGETSPFYFHQISLTGLSFTLSLLVFFLIKFLLFAFLLYFFYYCFFSFIYFLILFLFSFLFLLFLSFGLLLCLFIIVSFLFHSFLVFWRINEVTGQPKGECRMGGNMSLLFLSFYLKDTNDSGERGAGRE